MLILACGGDSSTVTEAVGSRGASVMGIVTVDGVGAPGLALALGTPSPRNVVTDSRGEYRLSGLPPGSFPLTLVGAEEGVFPQPVRVVEVELGSQLRLDFQGSLPRTAALTGQVTVGGVGLTGVGVILSGPELRNTPVDADGRFAFPGLVRGHWSLRLVGIDATRHAFPDSVRAVVLATGQARMEDFQGVRIPRPPSPPPPPVAQALTPRLVRVQWAADPDAVRYTLERRAGEGSWMVAARVEGTPTPVEDEGLQPGISYGYRVQACNDDGCSEFSPLVRVTTPQHPPVAPGALTATPLGPHRIRVEWSDLSPDETSFRIRRNGGNGWEQVGEVPGGTTRWEDVSLEPGTLYRYQVQGCGPGGCSPFSPEAAARTDDLPPASPEGLAAAVLSPTRIRLTWQDGAGVLSAVRVQRRTGGTWSEVGTAPAGAELFDDQEAVPATEHHYRVRGCNAAGCSPLTEVVNATTPDATPAPPTGLGATAVGADRIDLAWTDASTNETGFEIQRRPGGGSWGPLGSVGAGITTFQDPGLPPGTAFEYRVRACGVAGCSPWSGTAGANTGTPVPQAPTALVATAAGATRVILGWQDNSSNETGFEIQRRVGGGAWGTVHTTGPSATQWEDMAATTGELHRYRVRACNGGGCSAFTAEASATPAAAALNLNIEAVHLNQVIQDFNGGVPLVAGRGGVLRVFVRANMANTAQPRVRVRLYHGTSEVASYLLDAPGASVPQDPDLSTFGSSWNVTIPANLVVPGLRVLAQVDPDGAIPESDPSDNHFPAGGTPLSLDVRTVPPFRIRFVPVRQNATDLTGSVDANGMLTDALRLFPLQATEADVRAVYTTMLDTLKSNDSNNAWTQLLSELNTLRVAEGSGKHYYGVVRTTYSSGIAGYGYVGGRTGVGWDRASSASWVAAHEWGHNFGRLHAPCGVTGPDTSYPYAGGVIGQPGYNGSGLVSATAKDLMGYCSPRWVSDYTFSAVMAHRQAAGALGVATAGGPVPVTIVWGRMAADGSSGILEPAFEVTAPPVLPEGRGPFILEALDAAGTVLSTWSFQGIMTGEETQRHFTFALPTASLPTDRIAALRLRTASRVLAVRGMAGGAAGAPPGMPALAGGDAGLQVLRSGSQTEFQWEAAEAPLVVVRDPASGEILSLARSGQVEVTAPGGELEVILSDGIRSRTIRIRP